MSLQLFVSPLLILGLIAPTFGLAQTSPVPQTVEEAESLGLKILDKLPGAIKDVWQNQALPIWWNMWLWAKGFWESTLGAKVETLWQKFLNLIGKESPDIEGEFQKEKQEMQKDLWDKFLELLK